MSRRASPGGEGLCRHQRICLPVDYRRCYRQGRRSHGSLVSLHCLANDGRGVRLGITASRKVGNSVVRHRLKRRIREIFRRSDVRGQLQSTDVVVHVKPAAADVGFSQLSTEVRQLLSYLCH